MTDDERRERLAIEIADVRGSHFNPYGARDMEIRISTRLDALEWVRDNLDLGETK